MSDPDRFVILTTRDALARQARQALDQITASNGGVEPATLRDGYDVNPAAFGSDRKSVV